MEGIHTACYKGSTDVSDLFVFASGIVNNGPSADTLGLFLSMVIRCSGHSRAGPRET